MSLVVQKYGGTSVGSIEKIRDVARRVVERKKEGSDVVVVLSAMAGETDRLIRLAQEMTENPSPRELDCTDFHRRADLHRPVQHGRAKLGYKATSLLGFQVTIYTDQAYGRARISEIDTRRIMEEIRQDRIVAIAGFQGLDERGNITTLGRGGSDTTAVAVAAALKAEVCEIFTDVEGVYTTDPRVCSKARKLNKVTYEEMLEMASLGAKVLEIRSVEFAKKYKVPIHVRSTFTDEEGTMVLPEDKSMEKILVSAVTYNKNEARITITKVPDRPGIASKIFTPISEAGVVVDMIIQNTSADRPDGPDLHRPQGGFQKDHGDPEKGGQGDQGRAGPGGREYRQGLHYRAGHAQSCRGGHHHVRNAGPGGDQHHDDRHFRDQDLLRHRR